MEIDERVLAALESGTLSFLGFGERIGDVSPVEKAGAGHNASSLPKAPFFVTDRSRLDDEAYLL